MVQQGTSSRSSDDVGGSLCSFHFPPRRVNRTTTNRSLPPSSRISRSVRRDFRKSDFGSVGRLSKSRFTRSGFGSFTSACGMPSFCPVSIGRDQTPLLRSLRRGSRCSLDQYCKSLFSGQGTSTGTDLLQDIIREEDCTNMVH